MTERRSRCTVARPVPMEWRDYQAESHPSVQALAAWIESQVHFTQVWIVGELDALRELAAAGEIDFDPHPEDNPKAKLIPIRKNPDLYELRWKLLTSQIRQYHGEPTSDPDLLVDLHIHIKTSPAAQKVDIQHARERYAAGQPSRWA